MMAVWCMLTLAVLSATIPKASSNALKEYDYEFLSNEETPVLQLSSDDEFFDKIDSMMDGKQETSGELFIETNALVDTSKYRTWKRNVDLINTLLSLPKSMSDAGRRR